VRGALGTPSAALHPARVPGSGRSRVQVGGEGAGFWGVRRTRSATPGSRGRSPRASRRPTSRGSRERA
jgi:hypothetical protein